jgi:HD-like signal output (HDOD) protein
LTQALTDLDTDAEDVADIITQDPAMCAKLLQLVNSAFFSRAVMIVDVRQAVLRLGFQMVKHLVLAIEVFRAPEGSEPIAGFSIDALQQHALHAATLAGKLLSDKKQAEDAFLAALLHDIGQLILAVALPDKIETVLARAQSEEQPLYAVEKDLMGVSHAEIGAYLLGLWGGCRTRLSRPWRITTSPLGCHTVRALGSWRRCTWQTAWPVGQHSTSTISGSWVSRVNWRPGKTWPWN